jgi:hypothetical protein
MKRCKELEARHEQETKHREELEVRVAADAQRFQEMYLYI